jgi:hypothetical protein
VEIVWNPLLNPDWKGRHGPLKDPRHLDNTGDVSEGQCVVIYK